MGRVYFRFPSHRTFIAVDDIKKARNINRVYILFFDKSSLTKYFSINERFMKDGFDCFYIPPTKEGIENITDKEGYFYTAIIKNEKAALLLQENSGIGRPGNGLKFLILSEEQSTDDSSDKIIQIPHEICSIFYMPLDERLIPVTYSPFNFTEIELKENSEDSQYLSFGNEANFTVSFLENRTVTVSPCFGELESLYEIDAMNLLVNTIIGRSNFKDITVLKDNNSFSMINDYINRFSSVKTIDHIYSHFASVLFDNSFIKEKGIGIIYDTISYSSDNIIMGSEILYGRPGHCIIAGGWKPVPLPGGSIANIEPWRIPLAILKNIIPGSLDDLDIPLIKRVRKNNNFNYIYQAIDNKDIDYTFSSSMHHIMSAIGELLSFEEATYDLDFFEKKIDKISSPSHSKDHYIIPVIKDNGIPVIDTFSLFIQLLEDLKSNIEGDKLIIKAVESIALATAELALTISGCNDEKNVFLCGEIFRHAGLLKLVSSRLTEKGLNVHFPVNIPIDDSGISAGQSIYYFYSKGRDA